MLLRSVRVENFRAVKYANVSLDATTVLIGENDCGRSSLMEAVAIALGWDSKPGEFRFQPLHAHRPDSQSAPNRIAIALEFCETTPGEWNGEGFETLRSALPDVLTRDRRFWLEVNYAGDAVTYWMFRSAAEKPLIDDHGMLAWLRRRMPVFWMSEGMMARRRVGEGPGVPADRVPEDLASQVSDHYRDLLAGTAPDVSAAIEGGSAAARQLLLAGAKLLPNQTTPVAELLEEITGKKNSRPGDLTKSQGAAASKLGLLLLVGALLQSGVGQVEQGMDSLSLIENPEAHLHPMTLASIWSVIDRIGGQKIIATHSGTLLARVRLSSLRRLTRQSGIVKEWRVPDGSLTADELRRYSYHLRSRRAAASFARCWLLVEGETEFWLMDELARVCGYDFATEGVACVEFAQCGLSAVIKVAEHLGIEWHLLADGDAAGQQYARSARGFTGDGDVQIRLTVLEEPDVEHSFWRHGYKQVFLKAAYPASASDMDAVQRKTPAKAVIKRAIERHSKPYMAVLLVDAVMDRGPEGIPPRLRTAIESCIRLARHGWAK